MARTLDEWHDDCMESGTSGDMVFDIIRDGKAQLAAAQAEIERQRNLLITIDNLCMCMVGTDGAAMVVGNIRLLLEPEVRHAMEGENNDISS